MIYKIRKTYSSNDNIGNCNKQTSIRINRWTRQHAKIRRRENSSAGSSKLYLKNNVSWACFFTCTAICTFVIINMCTEVSNSDRTVWTGILTFFTSDTSDLTGGSYCFALCMGTASYECLLFVWHKFDQVMRTFGNTFTTGFAGFSVNDCNTIYDMDRIKRTGFYTASESHTAVIAGFGSAARDKCHHFTVFYTGISVIVVCLFAGTGTFYKCSHAGGFYNFLSHDSCDHFADRH